MMTMTVINSIKVNAAADLWVSRGICKRDEMDEKTAV